MDTAASVHAHINTLHGAVWELAALALVLRGEDGASAEQRRAAVDLLHAAGFMTACADHPDPVAGLAEAAAADSARLAAQAAATVLQAAAVLSGTRGWTGQSDDALLAQGRASAQGALPFRHFVVPRLEGLGELLASPSAAMLDVGVGVAAMAVAYCQVFPALRVVGLDVFPRALELAAGEVERAGMTNRIELRRQDVSTLEDRDSYSLAWLPAPFVPPPAIAAGLPRLVTALVPGGWLVVGHGRSDDGPRAAAVTRLQTVAFGGTPLAGDEVRRMLEDAGLERVATLPTPPGAPGLTVGRRPRAR